MVAACLMVMGQKLALASAVFTLGWNHSVEKTEWREQWRVEGAHLVLEEARLRGSGAGMEPGETARLVDGWWVWQPLQRMERLTLATSGFTGAGWQFCADGACRDLSGSPGSSQTLSPCAQQVQPR